MALLCYGMAGQAYSETDGGTPQWTAINFLRVAALVALLGLLPAWRGHWGLWSATLLFPVLVYVVIITSGP